ncbi:MAG: hypothetical protein KTR14_11435 [Vampirovibrio sp.]|nr:hypothetical protein [Vampirovibrio sp.]
MTLKSGKIRGGTIQVGGSFQIQGDVEMKQQIENSLELMRQERMRAAEAQAEAYLAQVNEQAAQLLADAEEKANELVTDAENRRDQVLQEAYDAGESAGFQKGYDDGIAKAEAETVDLLTGTQEILDSAYQARQTVLKGFRKQAAGLIQAVAEKVLHDEVKAPERLLDMVDQAVEALNLSGRVQVAVSAEALGNIRQYSRETDGALNRVSRYEFVADSKLRLDEIFVLNDLGTFDLSVASQAALLVDSMTKTLPVEAPDFPDTPPIKNQQQPAEQDDLESHEEITGDMTEHEPESFDDASMLDNTVTLEEDSVDTQAVEIQEVVFEDIEHIQAEEETELFTSEPEPSLPPIEHRDEEAVRKQADDEPVEVMDVVWEDFSGISEETALDNSQEQME